jgi:hypothetical protein
MTLYRARTVLLLFLLLIFATPVVGQEAGQRARGGVAPGSLDSVAPMSMVEGLLTPDLLQLEMEDGTIIARDDLIDPEYFVVDRAKTVLGTAVGMTALVALIEVVRKCALSGNENDGGWMPIPTEAACSGYSWPLVIGLGVGIGIPFSFLEGMAEGEWKPW